MRAAVVYVTPFWGPCERLKDHLRSAGVAFTVRDVMADEAAADFLESRGIFATPVLQVGDELLVGFQPEKIDRLLGRRATEDSP